MTRHIPAVLAVAALSLMAFYPGSTYAGDPELRQGIREVAAQAEPRILTAPQAPPGFSGNRIGGPDQWARDGSDLDDVELEIDATGRQWFAVQEKTSTGRNRIVVYNSDDGGDIWRFAFSVSHSDSDYVRPSLHVASGTQNRVYLAYVNASSGRLFVRVFTTGNTLLRIAALAPSVYMLDVTVTSDAGSFGSYYLYLAAVSFPGYSLWFTRSLDFGDSWETGYEVATSPADRNYINPQLAYGQGGFVHLAWQVNAGTSTDGAIFYRRAASFAGAGVASWQTTQDITGSTNGFTEISPSLVASVIGGDVLLAYAKVLNPVDEVFLNVSTNNGATWATGDSVSLGPGYQPALLQQPNVAGYIFSKLRSVSGFLSPVISRAVAGTPLSWANFDSLGDYGAIRGGTSRRLDLAYDPTRGDQFAMAWVNISFGAGTDTAWTDAEWHPRTPGTPYVEGRFPGVLLNPQFEPGIPQSHPALAAVDDSPGPEAIFVMNNAIQIRNLNASGLVGWPHPVEIPPPGPRAAVAVGDIDNDGFNEVAVGGWFGSVAVVRRDGTAYPGWPKDFGDDDTYVSMGPVLNMPVNQLVIVSGSQLHVMTAAGTEISGFPVAHPASIPVSGASIGDIDGNGSTDIVVAGGTTVRAYRNDGSLMFSRSGLVGNVTDAVALGDLDRDGDLELVVPTQSRVYVLEHNGADRTGWPFLVPGGAVGVSAVALAQARGTSELEVIFEAGGSVYMLQHNGAGYTGFPASVGGINFDHGGVAVDIIDQGSADILLGPSNRDSLARALSNFGVPSTAGWPKPLCSGAAGSTLIPALGDVDLDGRLEAVYLADGWINMVDMTATVAMSPTTRWPMYGFDARRTHCMNCSFPSTVGVPESPVAAGFLLHAPAPNPANGRTALAWDLPEDATVRLEIFDVAGRLVSVLVREEQRAGRHDQAWDGTDLTGQAAGAGVYLARLRSASGGRVVTRTQKITLIRP